MASARRSGPCLLIVEDDDSTRDILCQLLEGEGYKVNSAANGREALDRLRGSPLPQCILLDLRMPVMDGWEFRNRQLLDPALAPIPVVVLSAERNVRKEAASLGAAGYLHKPIEVDTLLGLVSQHCGPG